MAQSYYNWEKRGNSKAELFGGTINDEINQFPDSSNIDQTCNPLQVFNDFNLIMDVKPDY